jgi:methylmalonyl-CoA mutase
VMTPEFGAASQLEKIDMLDFAEFVAINKFDRKGAADALRDVAKQVQRNRRPSPRAREMPVFGTMASRFNDDGVTALYQALLPRLAALGLALTEGRLPLVDTRHSTHQTPIVPGGARALPGRHRRHRARLQAPRARAGPLAREVQQLRESARMLHEDDPARRRQEHRAGAGRRSAKPAGPAREEAAGHVARHAKGLCRRRVRGEDPRQGDPHRAGPHHAAATRSARWRCPPTSDHGELLKWLLLDNVPGSFPYTAGTFAFKREGEDPTRMFAGEGDAFRTNRRFKLVSEGMPAKRLSTAFDSVTLYGNDPDPRPDIYGKVGNSGVSIATLDDLKVLYSGFDLCPRPPASA